MYIRMSQFYSLRTLIWNIQDQQKSLLRFGKLYHWPAFDWRGCLFVALPGSRVLLVYIRLYDKSVCVGGCTICLCAVLICFVGADLWQDSRTRFCTQPRVYFAQQQ